MGEYDGTKSYNILGWKEKEKYRITMVFYFIIDPILMLLLSLPLLCEFPSFFCCCCGRRVGYFTVAAAAVVVV